MNLAAVKANLLLAAIVLAAAFIGGCDNSHDRRHPKYQNAISLKNSGNHEEAAARFEDFLLINPHSFSAHQELANLYHDHLDDRLLAVYHYRRYLLLAPDSEPREAVEAWLASAEREYYGILEDKYGGKYEVDELRGELDKFKDQNLKLRGYVIHLRGELKKFEQLAGKTEAKPAVEISEGKPGGDGEAAPRQEAGDKLDKEFEKLVSNRPSPAAAPQEAAPPPAEKKPPEFYVVVEGDTLMGISQKVYGHGKYFKQIYEANKDIVPENMQIRPGQRLKIPRVVEQVDEQNP